MGLFQAICKRRSTIYAESDGTNPACDCVHATQNIMLMAHSNKNETNQKKEPQIFILEVMEGTYENFGVFSKRF